MSMSPLPTRGGHSRRLPMNPCRGALLTKENLHRALEYLERGIVIKHGASMGGQPSHAGLRHVSASQSSSSQSMVSLPLTRPLSVLRTRVLQYKATLTIIVQSQMGPGTRGLMNKLGGVNRQEGVPSQERYLRQPSKVVCPCPTNTSKIRRLLRMGSSMDMTYQPYQEGGLRNMQKMISP
jgi:hypothetical protein